VATTETNPKREVFGKQLSREANEIIDMLERDYGRKLTEQEMNLSLEQARHIGDLRDEE
jgi:hypothetical protein